MTVTDEIRKLWAAWDAKIPKRHCKDCGKEAPPHKRTIDYGEGKHERICCYCFMFWAVNEVWEKATRKNDAAMLCIRCFRKRLRRKVTRKDFATGMCGGFNKPLKEMIEYANGRGANDSPLW